MDVLMIGGWIGCVDDWDWIDVLMIEGLDWMC